MMMRKEIVVFFCFLGYLLFLPINLVSEPDTQGQDSRAHIIISGEAKELIMAARRAEQAKDWDQVVKNYQKAMELYPNYLIPSKAAGLLPIQRAEQQSLQDKLRSAPSGAERQPLQSRQGGIRFAPSGDEVYLGVKHFCRESIRLLPPEGQMVYRKLFNQIAQKSFELAVRHQDAVQMEGLADRYLYTTAGLDALNWSVQYYLEKGSWLEAASCLEKLLTHPETANPGLVIAQLGIVDAKGGEKNKSADFSVNNWTTYGGDNTRTKLMGPAFKTRPPQAWSFPLPLPNFSLAEFLSFHRPEIAPDVNKYLLYWPVVENGVIYLSTGTGIYALNLFPIESGPAPILSGHELLWKFEDISASRLLFEERLIFSPVVHQGLVYVNLVGAINKEDPVLNNLLYAKLPIPNRILAAFDSLNGRMKWKVGGYPDWASNSDNQPKAEEDGASGNDDFYFLQKASFPVPPAVEGDIGQGAVVYTPAIYTANPTDLPEHYVCCLDAATGQLRWKTFVASGLLETNLFNNPTRESVPLLITVDEQNIYYCSNIGVLAALDKKSGNIKWIKKYQQYQIPPTTDLTSPRLPLTWVNNPLLYISKPGGPNYLIGAPIDSPFLYVLEADNANELWKWDGAELGNGRYILGVYEGLLILSGENKLIALNIAKEGKREWVADFKDDPIVGKGALTSEEIYLGTVNGLYKLNAKNGKIISKLPWSTGSDNQPAADALAGNLIILDGILVTVSAQRLNVFYDYAAIEKWLMAQIQEKPDEPLLLQRLGQVCLQARQFEKAIAYFKKAIETVTQKTSSSDEQQLKNSLRKLIFNSYLALVEEIQRGVLDRENQLKAINCLKEAGNWAVDTSSQIEVNVRLAELYRTAQEWDNVVDLYQSLLQENPEVVYQTGQVWEFARDEINELIERLGRQVYA
ncbi:MAG: PQQ-binding-like beta-propeller repeat protein, partial [Planctomycetota bacterium]